MLETPESLEAQGFLVDRPIGLLVFRHFHSNTEVKNDKENCYLHAL